MVRPGTSPTLGIRGIIATEAIPQGTLIEVPPILDIPPDEVQTLGATILGRYLFTTPWGAVLCLGWGSLYNHSPHNNAEVRIHGRRLMIFAIKDIQEGEEVFISYGDDEEELRTHYRF